jgi:hypothetical protein
MVETAVRSAQIAGWIRRILDVTSRIDDPALGRDRCADAILGIGRVGVLARARRRDDQSFDDRFIE